MSADSIIKRCASCGSTAGGHYCPLPGGGNFGTLGCKTCGKKTRDGQTFEAAIKEWNESLSESSPSDRLPNTSPEEVNREADRAWSVLENLPVPR